MNKTFVIILASLFSMIVNAQDFYTGADLSYVNELEDCGVVYNENGLAKDPYQIFADHNCKLIRLRLWHTPDWYDDLNAGSRYSDLADVKKSIQRAKTAGMEVLLDFHLSDNWADPSNQVVPEAWQGIVDDLEVLQDSLYNYIYQTLNDLLQDDLVPEMVQIGNETNKGILLSQAENDAGWVLDWDRNSQLFNKAIEAVRDFETNYNQSIQIALHIANPTQVDWYIENFIANGVDNFDIIGISYYHEWHGDATIEQVGNIIAALRGDYNKEVMVVEAGYPWTTAFNDNANNILNAQNVNYAPLNPENQKRWLVDLAKSIRNNGGKGLIYWEPAWVSSNCFTQWAQGSSYENACFFDFQNNLQANGGIKWMAETLLSAPTLSGLSNLEVLLVNHQRDLEIKLKNPQQDSFLVQLHSMDGRLVLNQVIQFDRTSIRVKLPELTLGVYILGISKPGQMLWSQKIPILQQ